MDQEVKPMDQEIKQQWVDTLRFGNYPQTVKSLQDDNGYCCLGVLCELAVKAGIIPAPVYAADDGISGTKVWHYDDDFTVVLPYRVSQWAGLPTDNPVIDPDNGKTAINCNDNGQSFSDIADLIQKNL
jgi:hypothetical protein